MYQERAMRGQNAEGAICKPGALLSTATSSASVLILTFCPASQSACLLFKSPSLWHFVKAAPAMQTETVLISACCPGGERMTHLWKLLVILLFLHVNEHAHVF